MPKAMPWPSLNVLLTWPRQTAQLPFRGNYLSDDLRRSRTGSPRIPPKDKQHQTLIPIGRNRCWLPVVLPHGCISPQIKLMGRDWE